MGSHRSFNFICKVVLTKSFVDFVNWPWAVFLKTPKFIRVTGFGDCILFAFGRPGVSSVPRFNFRLCSLF